MGEAEKLIEQGDKYLKGGFMSWFSGSKDYYEATRCYTGAANKYKLDNNWKKAGEAFLLAANAQQQANEPMQHASHTNEAADCIARYSLDESLPHYNTTIDSFNSQGRYGRSAKLCKKLAEAYENDNNMAVAMEYYEKAMKFFDLDEYGKFNYSQCRLKFADIASKEYNELEKCTIIYEEEGDKCLKNNVLKYNAKDHFLKAGILHLNIRDNVNSKIAIDKYCEKDSSFSSSKQGKFIISCLDAIENEDLDAFTETVQSYDQIYPLDSWKVHFLYRLREFLDTKCDAVTASTMQEETLDADGNIDLS